MFERILTIYNYFRKPEVPKYNLQWLPHEEKNPKYLHIDEKDFEMKKEYLNAKRWSYLNKIVEENDRLNKDPHQQRINFLRNFKTTLSELCTATIDE